MNECGPSLKNPERVFIADRAGRSTVVFDTRGELSDANKHWLKYGRLDLAAERRDDETIRGIRGMSVDTRVMVIGRLHEVIDLTAVEDGAEQADLDRKQPQKRTRGSDADLDRCGPSSAKKRRESDTVWPEEQQKALWIAQVSYDMPEICRRGALHHRALVQELQHADAQLRYGEGRDWDAVVSAVNVFPGGDTRTLKVRPTRQPPFRREAISLILGMQSPMDYPKGPTLRLRENCSPDIVSQVGRIVLSIGRVLCQASTASNLTSCLRLLKATHSEQYRSMPCATQFSPHFSMRLGPSCEELRVRGNSHYMHAYTGLH